MKSHTRFYLIEPGFSPIVERARVFRTAQSRENYVHRHSVFLAHKESPAAANFWRMNCERVDGWRKFCAYRFRNGGYVVVLSLIIIFTLMWVVW